MLIRRDSFRNTSSVVCSEYELKELEKERCWTVNVVHKTALPGPRGDYPASHQQGPLASCAVRSSLEIDVGRASHHVVVFLFFWPCCRAIPTPGKNYCQSLRLLTYDYRSLYYPFRPRVPSHFVISSQHWSLLNEQWLFITKCDRVVLQSATAILLQSATSVITKCGRYYKVWRSSLSFCYVFFRYGSLFTLSGVNGGNICSTSSHGAVTDSYILHRYHLRLG